MAITQCEASKKFHQDYIMLILVLDYPLRMIEEIEEIIMTLVPLWSI